MRSCVVAAAAFGIAGVACAEELSDYRVSDLMSPCVEADNDSRWGAAAETECEQYIVGFTDALILTGQVGVEATICLPQQNRADEIRWAFMRWVHEDYENHRAMPAADGLIEALKSKMPCS